jgi:hypothetical protein
MPNDKPQIPREHLFSCPRCGSHNVIRRGLYARRGEANWSCKDCNKYTIESKLLRQVLEDQSLDLMLAQSSVRELERAPRYFITSAQNATAISAGFVRNILHYCRVNEAELLVRPCKYRNPNSPVMRDQDEKDNWWPSEIYEYLVPNLVKLHPLFWYMGHVPINATSKNPLAGLEGLTRGASGVFGHPQLAMKSIATPQHAFPKLIYTSGSCSVRGNYSESKMGIQGEFHHTLAGVVLEKEGGRFHVRPVVADSEGSFCDLVWHYHGGTDTRIKRAAAMKIADEHVPFDDPEFNNATYYSKDAQVKVAKPRVISREDVGDSFAISHWHGNKAITRYAKHHSGHSDLKAELKRVFSHVVKTTPKDTLNLFTASNHHEHILRWLNENGDPRRDPQNLLIWCELMAGVLRDTRMGSQGVEHPDPFALWMAPKLKDAGIEARFLKPDESHRVGTWELGMHGHYGVNGARGSVASFTKIGTKILMGHIHSPAIDKNVWASGAGPRKLEYSAGPSSWMQTNLVLYGETGRPSHWHVVKDTWHANPRLAKEFGRPLRKVRRPR